MLNNSKKYSAIKHRIALSNIFLTPIILWVSLITGIPTYLKNLSHTFSSGEYVSLIIFYMLAGSFFYLINLPLEFYSDFIIERRFSLSNQTLKDWIIREAKKNSIAFIISAPLVIAMYLFLKLSPLYWWLWTAALWFLVSVLLAKFAPVVIVPFFYKYLPVKDAVLEGRINRLVSRFGFKLSGVYELNISKDTKKANAALLGIGKQKRIVLCDTLISNFSHDEIESVMAHELGHHRLNHIWKLIISGGFITFITFFFANELFLKLRAYFGFAHFYEYESLVLIYCVVSFLNIAFIPVENAFSRHMEKDADEFSLKATGNPNAFITAMKKLCEQNMGDADPDIFYEIMLYSHPPIKRRIAFAERFQQSPKDNPR